MHKRNITVGTILGAGLLGTLIALGQDSSAPPRPRPVMPPPVSDVAPPETFVPEKKTSAPAPIAFPDAQPLPSLPPLPNNRVETVQHIEPKTAPPLPQPPAFADAPPIARETKFAPPPALGESPVPQAPLPPAPPTNDNLPLPTPMPALEAPPVMPRPAQPRLEPKNEFSQPPIPSVEPDRKDPSRSARTPDGETAPPKAWSPADTPRVPISSTIEMSPPRPLPSIPVSNPKAATPGGGSRFVVSSKPGTQAPLPAYEPAIAAPPSAEPAPAPPGLRHFNMLQKPAAAHKPPGALPKLNDVVRPAVPDLHVPAQDPALGALTPQLTVEKRGPLLHKVGGSMQYQIVLRNIGTVAAQQVRVEDEVPGAQLIQTVPVVAQQQGDRLTWMLTTLRPGEERIFVEEMKPIRPGDVVSTTSVHVYASTSFRTKLDGDVPPPPPNATSPLLPPSHPTLSPIPSTPSSLLPPALTSPIWTPPALAQTPTPAAPTGTGPALNPPPIPNPAAETPVPQTPPAPMPMTLEVKALPTVGLGQKHTFDVIVGNKGTTPLTGMILHVKIPAGLLHPQGDNIEADLPNMGAGESKRYPMHVTAVRPGQYAVEIRVTAAPNCELVARPLVTVEANGVGGASNVSASSSPSGLSIQQSATAMLLMGKENEIKISVANNQPMPANQIQIVDVLADGLEYLGASDNGVYQSSNRTITWLLDTVPPGSARTISLRVQPKSTGSFPHEVIAKADGLPDAKSTSVYQVESFSTLQVQVRGKDNPLEVGKETVYQIRITNVGSSAATNVHANIALSSGLEPSGFAQAPAAYRISGKEVVFEPIPRVQAGETKTIFLGVRGVLAGQQSVRAQVASDQLRTPISREDRTQVYREK